MIKSYMRPALLTILCLLALAYIGMVWQSGLTFTAIVDKFYLFFIGIFAATIANSTGMGGGVVFLPAFEYISLQDGNTHDLALTAAQIIGMSFVIQSFGMTMGSSRWLYKAYSGDIVDTGIAENDFWRLIGWVLIFAVPALLATQYFLSVNKDFILLIFKGFSIALGVKLLIATWLTRYQGESRLTLAILDFQFLALAGVLGGMATALFSVGVGEFVALYLFIRNFPLVTCAATAVILSAVTVLIGLPWHLMYTDLPWGLLAIVIPGALIGGFLARSFALWLGNRRLKYLAASWIILSSLFLLLR